MSDSNSEPTHIEYGSKPFSAILLSLFLAEFASFSSLYCVQPMMPIFAKFFVVSPTHTRFPLSFSTVALAIGLLFTGLISERFGRKLIMVWVLFLAAILLILSSILPVWEIFLSIRVLIGISVSGVVAVAMTYIRILYFWNSYWWNGWAYYCRSYGRFYFLANGSLDSWHVLSQCLTI